MKKNTSKATLSPPEFTLNVSKFSAFISRPSIEAAFGMQGHVVLMDGSIAGTLGVIALMAECHMSLRQNMIYLAYASKNENAAKAAQFIKQMTEDHYQFSPDILCYSDYLLPAQLNEKYIDEHGVLLANFNKVFGGNDTTVVAHQPAVVNARPLLQEVTTKMYSDLAEELTTRYRSYHQQNVRVLPPYVFCDTMFGLALARMFASFRPSVLKAFVEAVTDDKKTNAALYKTISDGIFEYRTEESVALDGWPAFIHPEWR